MSEQIITRRQLASVEATATGNNIVLAAQGAGTSIRIWNIFAVPLTGTTNQVVSFNEDTTTAGPYFEKNLDTDTAEINILMNEPWIMATNTAFDILLATTGVIHCSILYDVEKRT